MFIHLNNIVKDSNKIAKHVRCASEREKEKDTLLNKDSNEFSFPKIFHRKLNLICIHFRHS